MRLDITGSVSRLRPSSCTSTVAWPMIVARISPPSTRSSGLATGTSSTDVGHGPRDLDASQRSAALRPLAGRPLALWNLPLPRGAGSKALEGRGWVTSWVGSVSARL